MAKIKKSAFTFLEDLNANNTREWFAENKPRYQEEREGLEQFADELLLEMNAHDTIGTVSGKKSLYRIYRDIRFSKDKTPYKTHWSGQFKRATSRLRGGYFFNIEKGNSFVAGGFWGPSPEDLKLLRQQIANDQDALREVINSKSFKTNFGEMLGDQLKTAPKGFPKDHSAIDLLRYKQYLVRHDFTDEEVVAKDFARKSSKVFQAMRPFFDLMSDFLTTDLNGELVE